MNKYIILSAEKTGSLADRLRLLYLKLGSYLDKEKTEQRTIQYCKVFVSDAQNQQALFTRSLLYSELLTHCPLSIIEQPPLDGSKISLLVKTTDEETTMIFHSLRLTDQEAEGKDSYQQTRLLFDKYLQTINDTGMTMERNLLRTWIYVKDIDTNYQGVVDARNDVFALNGMGGEDSHYIASTGIGGCTDVRQAKVAMDFLSFPHIKEEDKQYLQATDHLNPTREYGVAFERGTALTIGGKKTLYISGTASIDHLGKILYEGDVARQTGRLLENIGALLNDGGATMKDIRYFIVYLRDISDHDLVEKMMTALYPSIPHIIVEARVCRPGWLIEMECIAEK